jgi:hypothetical protein
MALRFLDIGETSRRTTHVVVRKKRERWMRQFNMAKQRLFPEPEKHSENAQSGSRTNFAKIGSKVFSISKAEIDERETALAGIT